MTKRLTMVKAAQRIDSLLTDIRCCDNEEDLQSLCGQVEELAYKIEDILESAATFEYCDRECITFDEVPPFAGSDPVDMINVEDIPF